jgi:hypothetical protein
MKRLILNAILIFVLILSAPGMLYSQFTKSDRLLSGGLSAGNYGRYAHDLPGYSLSVIPPFYLQFERGIDESSFFAEYSKYITSGVFAGMGSQYYLKDYYNPVSTLSYEIWRRYTYFNAGILGSFHYTPFLEEIDLTLDPEKFDLFLTLRAGLVLQNFKSNFDEDPTLPEVQSDIFEMNEKSYFFFLAPTAGGRYYFSDKFGFHVELGFFNMSKISAGLTYRL